MTAKEELYPFTCHYEPQGKDKDMAQQAQSILLGTMSVAVQELPILHQALSQPKRAVIYCLVSTDKQEQDDESLEYQEESCRRYAVPRGSLRIVTYR
jgi:hypothetical protein